MLSDSVIELNGVSKCYANFGRPIDRLFQLFREKRVESQGFWALKNIDLKVEQGETLGVVGQNGSGKSTLLQLIVGTLTPTEGEISCRGRISAILELGAGFNPEFTGMENARLNAAIVGMPKSEFEERIPQIVDFSELGEFMDRPVKTYSSGMHIRLAFSVVINMEPDILVIDEALAVGDSRFQRKCYRKLDQLRSSGTTILFVTHATDAVITHCDRAVFLEGGRIIESGAPKTVVNHYLESLFERQGSARVGKKASWEAESSLPPNRLSVNPGFDGCKYRPWYNESEYDWGEGAARIFDCVVTDTQERAIGATVSSGTEIVVSFSVYFHDSQKDLIYGLTIKTVDGTAVFGTNSERLGTAVEPVSSGTVVHIRFRITLALIGAEYFVSLGVVTREGAGEEAVLHRRYDLIRLKVQDDQSAFGYAALPVSLTIEQAGAENE